MMGATSEPERTMGLFGATSVGVAAIIGGGILALAGPAFSSTGPSATLAVALGGAVAFITAMSFAELATAFPESGGAYVFANKVLSIRAAFAVGWVLWFAYIVACVLYALGFAAFVVLMVRDLIQLAGATPPTWLSSHAALVVPAAAACVYYTFMLTRHASGGGNWINMAKMGIFAVLIVGGLIALLFGDAPIAASTAPLRPFFTGGISGLLHAMGVTFVILHGFEVIAAVGGEVKDPRRVIPRSMFLSVGIAVAVYVPILFFASTVGVPKDMTLSALTASHGDTLVAAAVREYMGPLGYALVVVVAIFAFLSALRANLMAGSRIARSMARDQTLPAVLGRTHAVHNTPAAAVYATGLAVVLVLFVLPNLEAAGAAASLIFLLSFALAHVTAYLARKRATPHANIYRTPWFPLVPALGVTSCAVLAVVEAVAVPEAGRITVMWLGFGVILYLALFRTHAEIADASVEGRDPSLGRLRGKEPLVVVPVASPANARTLVDVANMLAPNEYARVLLLSVVAPPEASSQDPLGNLGDAQRAVGEALGASLRAGHAPDALISISDDAWAQIRRVARFHECESLLLGLGQLPSGQGTLSPELEALLDDIDCDVALMRVPPGWQLDAAKRILVPIGGKGEEHKLRARILGSLCRAGERVFHFVAVMSASSSDDDCEQALSRVRRLARSHVPGEPEVEVLKDDDPVAALRRAAETADLVVLGLRSDGARRRITSRISLAIASEANCAALLLSSKPSLGYRDVYAPIRNVIDALGPGEDASQQA